MINPDFLLNFLRKRNINFYTGVPDSVLKNFIEIIPNKKNIIAANEGSAVSIAIGSYLGSGKLPLVYMQNSGLSNAINPLISIAHPKVYSIPLILMIGWRGAPGLKDEPQHELKGKITKNILKLLNIKYCTLRDCVDLKKLDLLIKYALKKSRPVAFLIKSNNFFLNNKKNTVKNIKKKNLTRSYVIEEILKNIDKKSRIISTVGYTSRELFQIRKENNYKYGKDFYMVGGMGHSAMVSLGYSLNANKQTICLDGDGSILMHLGSLVSAGFKAKENFKHILLNNGSHESVGDQKIDSQKVNFKKVISGLGYKKYYIAKNKNIFLKNLSKFLKMKGPVFFEIYINTGSLVNLNRPKNLIEIKKEFIS
jgi:phosphonopyruvate decarboxylase